MSLKRPVSSRFRVPRRPVPVWNLSDLGFCAHLPSDCNFLCFQLSKPLHSLCQLESINMLYLLGNDLLAESLNPKMPRPTKSTKASSSAMENLQEEFSECEDTPNSDQEQDPEVFFQPSQAQVGTNMFMPYIEVPKMDWMVNDGVYHRFLKWHLKCENTLEIEPAMLPERRKCKKELLGAVILTWTSMFPGACPVRS